MHDLGLLALRSIWYVLPSYFANMAPVLLGGGRPLDMNMKFIDGERLLGEHKTIRGFLSGVLVGTIVGCVQGRPLSGFLLSFGAMVGDAFGSFIKRRLKLRPGASAPLLDQEGFLVFSIVFSWWAEPISLDMVTFLLITTPILHKVTNIVAYRLGLKEVGH
ncbi:MAG: CDP-2,3-bis-(O-geranylgeranyl)-sn-glycerol synthase [Candidatus Korarchaeota archaeon]|nr:CDP-2,3-bis-(O-geranylgeranyl)-sn-glycerol synthase [Candidatus Korarchaeota archaeon]